ncbi:MAG: hypothetical protein AAF556_07910, partial [Pseudomonadota bacterium]
ALFSPLEGGVGSPDHDAFISASIANQYPDRAAAFAATQPPMTPATLAPVVIAGTGMTPPALMEPPSAPAAPLVDTTPPAAPAPVAPWTAAATDRADLVQSLNNPMGIALSGVDWAGKSTEQTDRAFMRFDDPIAGLRAGARSLMTLERRHGEMTAGDALARYYGFDPNNLSESQRAVVMRAGEHLPGPDGMSVEDRLNQTVSLGPVADGMGSPDTVALMRAIATERNGGRDPFASHPQFYSMAADLGTQSINTAQYRARLEAMTAEMVGPDGQLFEGQTRRGGGLTAERERAVMPA